MAGIERKDRVGRRKLCEYVYKLAKILPQTIMSSGSTQRKRVRERVGNDVSIIMVMQLTRCPLMGQIFVYINMPIVDTLFCLPQYINLLITRVSSLFAGKYHIDFAFVDVSSGGIFLRRNCRTTP